MHHALRGIATDAVAYWEAYRLRYNLVLAAVVLGYFLLNLPKSLFAINVDRVLGLFALAVLANVAYCSAYVADVFVQFSGFSEPWRKRRWMVFAAGCGLAAVITRAIVLGELQDALGVR